MKGEFEFSFTVRRPTAAGVAATALYVTGMAMINWSVPRSGIVPVTVGEVAVYVAAFLVIPALLLRRAGRKGAGRG